MSGNFTIQAIGGWDFIPAPCLKTFARDCAIAIEAALGARCSEHGIRVEDLNPDRFKRISEVGNPLAEDWYVDGIHLFGTLWTPPASFEITVKKQCPRAKV